MIKAVTIPLGLILLLAAVPAAWSQAATDQETAVAEGVRRQAAKITLRQTLEQAQAAESQHELPAAAKLYDKCWDLIQSIGPGVEAETEATQTGLAAARLPMAAQAQSRGDLRGAAQQVDDVLRVDPGNQAAVAFKRQNDKLLAEELPRMPSADVSSQVPGILAQRATNNSHVQDGKLLFEMGKYNESEKILKQALKEDPQNQAAFYYLNLITERRYKFAVDKKEAVTKQSLVEVEDDWATPRKRDLLPMPNMYARTNLIYTSKGRQAIYAKLDRIRLDNIGWDGLPLSEVVKNLSDEALKRDPAKQGINFIVNPNTDVGGAAVGAPTAIDPATGLPVAAAAPAEAVDINATSVKLSPALRDVRMADVLDAIIKVADKRIKYSVEDYAVVFSLRGQELAPLYPRIIKVDPNTFMQGLEAVTGYSIDTSSGSSGGGGGGTGGGGGGGTSGGGGGQGGQTGGSIIIPRVSLTGGSSGGQSGGGQQGGGGQGGGGVLNLTRTNDQISAQTLVRNFFTTMGIDLTPPKSVFFNDREGSLVVYATLAELDRIETAVQVLNIAPPQVNLKAKFVEVSQNDSKALGFDYYLGNTLMNNGSMGFQGGTAPSFNGVPTTANPAGSFPSPTIPPASTDQLLNQGLRNTIGTRNPIPVPTLATFTGILTDPQFRVVIHALEQRDGVDLLDEATVNTLSGRQAQIEAVDITTIVTANSAQQNTSGGGGNNGGGGNAAVGTTINPTTQALPFGTTLDVIPYVSADGFTIQLTIIPTLTEFLGYDNPGQFVVVAQSVSGGAGGSAQPITAQLPLPRIRLRQVTTSAIVWDGQTVVLGGLISEDVAKIKDKIPILGDLPYIGRLFRSESSTSSKRNLLIFVTPTILDPAGNRFHSEDEMPFAQNAIPPQQPVAQSAK